MNRMLQCLLCVALLLMAGCTLNRTHRVEYPPSTDLFVTSGDDPASESQKPYVPKGQFIHVAQEYYLPFPLLGMFVKIGEAEPQYVFDHHIIPRVREMGGDALTNAKVSYIPPGPILSGLLGFRSGGVTTVSGQAVKR